MPIFTAFELHTRMSGSCFGAKFHQKPKPIALLFGKKLPIFTAFQHHTRISGSCFGAKFHQKPKPIALLFA